MESGLIGAGVLPEDNFRFLVEIFSSLITEFDDGKTTSH
jgi:hypothetical protein